MRRRRRQLGKTARAGTRTGAVEIDLDAVTKLAEDLAAGYRPCGGEAERRLDYVAPTVQSCRRFDYREASTGRWREAAVCAGTEAAREGAPPVKSEYGEPRDAWEPGELNVYARERVCMSRRDWAHLLYVTIAHELTHAADPGLARERRPYIRAMQAKDFCAYATQPVELTARVGEAYAELRSWRVRYPAIVARRHGFLERPEQYLEHSTTYRELEPCLAPAQRRRFLRMAAAAWEHSGMAKVKPKSE